MNTTTKDIEEQPDLSDLSFQGVMECQFSTLTQTNMIRKDPIFKTLMLSRKGQYYLLLLLARHLFESVLQAN